MTTMECDGTFGPGFRQAKMYGGVTSVDEISRWLSIYAEINWRTH